MVENQSHKTLIDVLDDLGHLRQNLLLIQAAFLAFEGAFTNTSLSYQGPPYQFEEVAQYFIIEFIKLDSDKKLREAIAFLSSHRDELNSQIPQD